MVSDKFLRNLKKYVPNDVTEMSKEMVDLVRNYQHVTKFNNKIIYEDGDSIDIIYDFMAKHYMKLWPEPRKEKRLKPKKNPYFSKKFKFASDIVKVKNGLTYKYLSSTHNDHPIGMGPDGTKEDSLQQLSD